MAMSRKPKRKAPLVCSVAIARPPEAKNWRGQRRRRISKAVPETIWPQVGATPKQPSIGAKGTVSGEVIAADGRMVPIP
jgi:hypothetical protein